jgi:uncharacterized protein YegP (UPF0339 family)
MIIELWQAKGDGLWYFHVRARNGEITLPAEAFGHGYKAKRDLLRAIDALKLGLRAAPLREMSEKDAGVRAAARGNGGKKPQGKAA